MSFRIEKVMTSLKLLGMKRENQEKILVYLYPSGAKMTVVKNLILAQPLYCVTLDRQIFKSLQGR